MSCARLVPWLCSRSQLGIKVIIRGLWGHLLHTVTFLVCWWICISFCTTTVEQQPTCTVIFEISRSNRLMAAIFNLLMRSDQEDGYLKMCTRSLTAKRWQNIVPYSFPNVTNRSLNLCNNSDQTSFSNTLTFARSLKTWQTLMHGKPRLIPILGAVILWCNSPE